MPVSPDLAQLEAQFAAACSRRLNLDLTRGKPAADQLDLANALDGVLQGDYRAEDGTDTRNYGGLYGLPEARRLGAELLGAAPEEVLCGGNSSLTLMYQYALLGHLFGFVDAEHSWSAESRERGRAVRFLCPVPGYDRHFAVCEQLGIDMTTVPMLDTGPDMDRVEAELRADPMIKGIWCVPRYSNPTGVTFDAATVQRMALLPRIAGSGFRVFWDNAYAVHHLFDAPDALLDIMPLARAAGTADGIVMFGSTAKITFAGGGIAFLATSPANLNRFVDWLGTTTIGPDKVNQLRHVRFFGDFSGLEAHMRRHAQLLRPKFELVQSILSRDLGNPGRADRGPGDNRGPDHTGIASWTEPRGGYFVSLDTLPGQASEVIRLAAAAGVKLTPAGATFPYGNDPEDRNIRIAPSFAGLDDLREALEVLTLCVRLGAARASAQTQQD